MLNKLELAYTGYRVRFLEGVHCLRSQRERQKQDVASMRAALFDNVRNVLGLTTRDMMTSEDVVPVCTRLFTSVTVTDMDRSGHHAWTHSQAPTKAYLRRNLRRPGAYRCCLCRDTPLNGHRYVVAPILTTYSRAKPLKMIREGHVPAERPVKR